MPFRTEMAAMSPDGKYLAYTVRQNGMLSVWVVEIDKPSTATAMVTVVSDEQATPLASRHTEEKTPSRLRWMGWVTSTRLLVETNRNFPASFEIGKETGWVNSTGELIAFDFNGKGAASIVAPGKLTETVMVKGKTLRLPRSPHVVDYSAESPTAVIIQAEGFARENSTRYVERYSLDVVTGKLTSLKAETVPPDSACLLDRQGLPKVALPTTIRDSYPHRFTFNSGRLFKKPVPLDELARFGSPAGFAVAPENYFGQRSVPIGFDYDSSVLYFASNMGRDTYGIYSMDMKSGQKTGFAAESALYDLYCPGPDLFPDNGGRSMFDRDEPISDPFSEDALAQVEEISSEGSSAPSQAGMTSTIASPTTFGVQLSDKSLLKQLDRQAQSALSFASSGESILVFDRFERKLVGLRYEGATRTAQWFLPELTDVQSTIEKVYPGRSAEVLEWDSAKRRFLVRVRGPVDSGAFFIFDSATKRLQEFVARSAVLNREVTHNTSSFAFDTPSGRRISGTVTFPQAARSLPVPTVVLCPPMPWERLHADFQPELQALADMGFAVVQVHSRGAWGFGVKHRESIKDGFETGQVEDLIAAVDHLSRQVALNPKRLALVGQQHGGYLALRALQLRPDRFRCAAALEAIVDVNGWLASSRWTNAASGPELVKEYLADAKQVKESPLVDHPELITKPVLLLNYRGEPDGQLPAAYVRARTLVNAVNRKEVPAELVDLTGDYLAGFPRAKAAAYRSIEEFLNAYIYDYKVKLGDLKILKD